MASDHPALRKSRSSGRLGDSQANAWPEGGGGRPGPPPHGAGAAAAGRQIDGRACALRQPPILERVSGGGSGPGRAHAPGPSITTPGECVPRLGWPFAWARRCTVRPLCAWALDGYAVPTPLPWPTTTTFIRLFPRHPPSWQCAALTPAASRRACTIHFCCPYALFVHKGPRPLWQRPLNKAGGTRTLFPPRPPRSRGPRCCAVRLHPPPVSPPSPAPGPLVGRVCRSQPRAQKNPFPSPALTNPVSALCRTG